MTFETSFATISLDSPQRALTFGQFPVSNTKSLAGHPDMGRVVPEFDIPELREIVVRSYRVIYRVDHANFRVDVIRFWHAARGNPEVESA